MTSSGQRGPTVVAVFGVDPVRIGGVEIYTKELARQLQGRGAVLVAVFSKKPVGVVAEFLKAPNLTIEAIEGLEERPVGSLPPLAAILRKYRPQVAHFQFVNFVGGFPWVARICNVPRVFFTAQGSEPIGFQARRSSFIKRMLIRLINAPIDRVFCISEYVRRMLVIRDLLPENRYLRVYNAILPPALDNAPEQRRAFRQRFNIPADCPLITQVSWIIPEKGIPQLLEAARKVLAEVPEARFAIVGSGSFEAEYKQRAQEMGIAGSVVWTGSILNPMEEGVYAAADIFCLASQWQEAFGWVIAEAMAFEKPVVATAAGGIPEVVEDTVTGLLVDPASDTALLAAQILRLLREPETRQRMGLAGRKAVEEKFDLRRTVGEVISEYRI